MPCAGKTAEAMAGVAGKGFLLFEQPRHHHCQEQDSGRQYADLFDPEAPAAEAVQESLLWVSDLLPILQLLVDAPRHFITGRVLDKIKQHREDHEAHDPKETAAVNVNPRRGIDHQRPHDRQQSEGDETHLSAEPIRITIQASCTTFLSAVAMTRPHSLATALEVPDGRFGHHRPRPGKHLL